MPSSFTNYFVNPKSASLILKFLSKKIFSAFMSLCAYPLLWVNSKEANIYLKIYLQTLSENYSPLETKLKSSPFSANSNTKAVSVVYFFELNRVYFSSYIISIISITHMPWILPYEIKYQLMLSNQAITSYIAFPSRCGICVVICFIE